MNEDMKRILEAGYAGVAIWTIDGGKCWLGCLSKGKDPTPDYGTNLWNYQDDPATVLSRLVENAEANKK